MFGDNRLQHSLKNICWTLFRHIWSIGFGPCRWVTRNDPHALGACHHHVSRSKRQLRTWSYSSLFHSLESRTFSSGGTIPNVVSSAVGKTAVIVYQTCWDKQGGMLLRVLVGFFAREFIDATVTAAAGIPRSLRIDLAFEHCFSWRKRFQKRRLENNIPLARLFAALCRHVKWTSGDRSLADTEGSSKVYDFHPLQRALSERTYHCIRAH